MQKIAVMDMDSICYVIGHPNKVLDAGGEPVKENGKFVYYDKTSEELKSSMNTVMRSVLSNCGATHYLAFMKGQNTTDRRKADNPNYKANRSQEEPKWWKEVQNNLFVHWQAKYVNDIEVDDAVNIARLKLPNAFICAVDKDLLSLKGTHFNWKKGEWVTVSDKEAEYAFWEDMIAGQVGDNIKGIPGKGPAYARKILMDPMGVLTRTNPANHVFKAYLDRFGEAKGIKEYCRNYLSLKILDEFEHFNIPQPVEIQFKEA